MRGNSRLYLCLWGCGLWLWWLGGAGPWAWCDAAKSAGSKLGTVAKAPPAASTAEAGYTGERISLELKDADLKDFFRLIGGISGLNIVLDPDVEGALTLFLKEVPWDQALDVVLENQGLGRHLSGNVLRIARLSTLESEQQQRQRLSQARVAAAELETRIRRPSFAKAAELSPILKKALSPRGDIIVDERTNALVISDIPSRLQAVDTLLRELDRKVRQVEIEARVVAASRSFLQDIGVQWSALYGRQARTGQQEASDPEPSFTRFPVLDAPAAGEAAAGEERSRLNLDLRTGLPASPLNLAAGLAADLVLDTLITAAERKGNAKLLSKPRILTQNNVEGVVKQGIQIPIQTTVNNTVSARFIDFVLRLTVTPRITRRDAIPAERGHREFHTRFFPPGSGNPHGQHPPDHHHHPGGKRRHGGNRGNTHRQPPGQPQPGARAGRNPHRGRPLPQPLPGPGNPGTAVLPLAEDSVGTGDTGGEHF